MNWSRISGPGREIEVLVETAQFEQPVVSGPVKEGWVAEGP